jgi:hypothetical protein
MIRRENEKVVGKEEKGARKRKTRGRDIRKKGEQEEGRKGSEGKSGGRGEGLREGETKRGKTVLPQSYKNCHPVPESYKS